MKLMEVLGLYPEMCKVGHREQAQLPYDGQILGPGCHV